MEPELLALSLLHWPTLLLLLSLAVEVAPVAEVVVVEPVPTFTVLPLPLSELVLVFELLFELCLFPIDAMPLASDLDTDSKVSSPDRAAMSWEGADVVSIRLPIDCPRLKEAWSQPVEKRCVHLPLLALRYPIAPSSEERLLSRSLKAGWPASSIE